MTLLRVELLRITSLPTWSSSKGKLPTYLSSLDLNLPKVPDDIKGATYLQLLAFNLANQVRTILTPLAE